MPQLASFGGQNSRYFSILYRGQSAIRPFSGADVRVCESSFSLEAKRTCAATMVIAAATVRSISEVNLRLSLEAACVSAGGRSFAQKVLLAFQGKAIGDVVQR